MAFLNETGLAYFWNQILARLNKFVPAESGKGLSSNDYTVEEKEKLAGIEVGANKTIVDSTLSATSTNPVQNKVVNTKFETIQAEVDSKVDSIDGKGLSTEDYTTEEKTKLASIAEGAEVNVQADWNEAATSNDAYIVNKPTIPSKTSDLTNDSGFLTSIPDEYVTETELTAKGYLTSYTETDPTVPAWAKQPKKPSYTAGEVGALPADTLPEAINTALTQAKASGEFDGADGKSAYQYAADGGYTGTEAEFAAKLAQEIHPGTYPVVEMTTDVAELAPNAYCKWGEVSSLTITLGAAIEGVTNEYCFAFVSGATATKLTVPSTIKWVHEPTVEAGKTYQVSILNGIGVICGA